MPTSFFRYQPRRPSRPGRASRILVAALLCAAAQMIAPQRAAASENAEKSTAPQAENTGEDASLPAGVSFSTVPKAYVLSLGGVMTYKSALPNRDYAQPGKPSRGLNGGELLGEWLWQLGGFRSSWPVWLGYYLGWIHLPGDANSQRTGVLEYGVRVRHGYRLSPTVRPFFTYCLGATQVWIDGLPGRGITHQTRTGLGVDLKIARRMRLLLAAEWVRQTLPDLGSTVDRSFSAVTLNVGVVFEREAH